MPLQNWRGARRLTRDLKANWLAQIEECEAKTNHGAHELKLSCCSFRESRSLPEECYGRTLESASLLSKVSVLCAFVFDLTCVCFSGVWSVQTRQFPAYLPILTRAYRSILLKSMLANHLCSRRKISQLANKVIKKTLLILRTEEDRFNLMITAKQRN